VRVHHVERQLRGVERHAVLARHLERVQVDARVLVPGEAQVAHLPRGLRLHERGVRPVLGEDPVRVLVAQHLVVLHEVDAVGAEPPQRLVELPRRLALGAAVDLRHQEDAVAVAVRERAPHPALALAVVVVPAVVHEGDAAVHRAAHQPLGERRVHVLEGEVPPAEPDRRHPLAGAPERAVRHPA
jgi:hypothetical protein